MRRHGFTIVEMLVGAALIAVVLGAIFSFTGIIGRFNRAAEATELLKQALLLEEELMTDVIQMGMDPATANSFFVSGTGFSFYHVSFENQEIRLRPVAYQLRKAGAFFHLVRRTVANGRISERVHRQAPLSAGRFDLVSDPTWGNRYLRFSFVLSDPDQPQSRRNSAGFIQANTHSFVLRLASPSELGNSALAPSFRMLPEADLLPL
jgi:prepilin-type N-terminal cleavage/methylation domain-containing protein